MDIAADLASFGAAPQHSSPHEQLELTILMPCLNEAGTVGACVTKARRFLAEACIRGEVLVADNGSTDGSPAIAHQHGARVVHVPRRGYGAALIAGIEAARGRYVVMGDADDSYDFGALGAFVGQLRQGSQLVMGNRFAGGIKPGAMPALHRYLGNPVLSFLGRTFFRTPIRDFHCGLRGFDRGAILSLNLCCEGMEFASEMVVKASLYGLRISEVATTLSPDGRGRPPHLRSWRDGWRHLRFLLLFCPRWLFVYPGLALIVIGIAVQALLQPGPVSVAGVTLDVHTMLYGAMATLSGLQMLTFGLFAMVYAADHGILPQGPWIKRLRHPSTLEVGAVLGVLLTVCGLVLSVYSIVAWDRAAFGPFAPAVGMRIVIPSLSVLVGGLQLLFASMFLGVLGLRRHSRPTL